MKTDKYLYMKQLITIVALLILSDNVDAQKHMFEDYDFDDSKIEIPTEYQNEDELIIFNKRKIDIYTDETSVIQYFLYHQKIWVNSDDAIEKNNRIYIHAGRQEEIVFNKNRVVLPDGNILELNEDDIHEETDQNTGATYEYYAVKGLEKGAFIEKLYLIKEVPNFTGISYNFQASSPILKSTFELYYPPHLILDHKSYNGLPDAIETDSTEFGKKLLSIEDTNIAPSHDDEFMCNTVRHSKKFRFKLFENLANGKRNFYNYKEFVSNFHLRLSEEISKKVYNISYKENEDLSDVIKSKQTNLFLLLKLYREALKKYGIKNEIILTTDRFKKYFDRDFETTNHLDEALIYLPEQDQYIDPTEMMYRTPLFAYEYGNNWGVKIKEVEFGGATMAVEEIVFIELPGMEITSDTMRIKVDFSESPENPSIKSKIQFGGYAAAYFQPIKDLVPADQFDVILKDIAKNYAADVEIDELNTEHDGIEYLSREKFGLEVNFKGEELIQQAGDKLIFKVGEIIGKQSQIYQTEERQYPVEIQYPHYYHREIDIVIPEEYKISNPEVFEMYFKTEIDGKIEALFDCNYTQEGKVLHVKNIEYYDAVEYPKDKYDDYSAVINAAADFNKLVIVLEKE